MSFTGFKFLQECLQQYFRTQYGDFMSIDWLPVDDRRFEAHIYTEPCWTRTIRKLLFGAQKDLKHLYDIFDQFQEGSVILAEGNSFPFFNRHLKRKSNVWKKCCLL